MKTWADYHPEDDELFRRPWIDWPCERIDTELTLSSQPCIVRSAGQELFTAGAQGEVFHSEDLGRTWSLLAPSIELSQGLAVPNWLPPATGFLAGGVVLRIVDRILPHLHLGYPIEEAEGIETRWRRSILLVSAITLHNAPEGLAIGVAFGAVAVGAPAATLSAAVVLALGIGIQNLPEGLAVSMPLRREGMSRLRSFWYGQLSGVVEPVAGVLGASAVYLARPILPYALAFAAGAMIFVVIEELIPEAQREGDTDTTTAAAMLGFVVMMILDVAFA